ncbi:MAG TPA: tRNA (adenosine(37)-N6)-threonylcarbamoyltransferase complex dimerization subunit type 1 TsaB [Solirubrobacteraceae bacterium]|nr:tRNA (adenosine(37)-N6)-threonylcarbamoyltransferase complex dimerization subunit type 1 TsaB [Solirubrobacteraceae bacterium]
MIVLGFDTATPATAIALRLADGSAVQARDDPGPGEHPGHATRLLPLVADLLARTGLRFRDLERIAVGLGPGTFTGLRIGVATARGLAQSLSLGLAGVSSLQALAAAAARGEHELAEPSTRVGAARTGVLAVLDARRGEVFAAAYSNRRELAAPRALAPADLGDVLEEARRSGSVERWVAVGDGAVRFRGELQAHGVDVAREDSPLHQVSGEAICELAMTAPVRPFQTVLPDYRRRPDAEIALEGAGVGPGARA